MHEYRRPLVNTLVARMREPRRFIQMLVGPRQTGKSTAIRQALAQVDLPRHVALASICLLYTSRGQFVGSVAAAIALTFVQSDLGLAMVSAGVIFANVSAMAAATDPTNWPSWMHSSPQPRCV